MVKILYDGGNKIVKTLYNKETIEKKTIQIGDYIAKGLYDEKTLQLGDYIMRGLYSKKTF